MTQHFYQQLYKQHSNKTIGTWAIEVTCNDDGTANMDSIACKVIGGAEVRTPRIISKGKNIGRANETTPLMQAVFEAQSKVEKKLKSGYVTSLEAAQEKATNSLGFVQPMLAQSIDKVKAWAFPVAVQRKLDGHRMLATVSEDKQVILYSRAGNAIHLPHIQSILQGVYDMGIWDGTTLDGEIYQHGKSLQTISSLVKKHKEGSQELVYHLYDVVKPNESYQARLAQIQHIASIIDSVSVIALETHIIESDAELNQLHSSFLSEGYEGTIVRQIHVGYEDGKRSKSVMKKKDFDDNEFEIIGYKLGTPHINDARTLQLPVFKCITPTGIEFECNAPGSFDERHQLYRDGLDKLVGKPLTVQHFGYTDRGAPFIPTPIRLREDL